MKDRYGDEVTRFCKTCNGFLKGGKTYCSKKCNTKTYVSLNCKTCSKEIFKSKYNAGLYKDHFCNRACLKIFKSKDKIFIECIVCLETFSISKSHFNMSETHTRKYCSYDCMNRCSIIRKDRLDRISVMQTNTGPTKLEIFGRKLLDELGISFLEQQKVNNRFIVDVIIPDYDLIIEWDGDYWHGHERFKNPNELQLKAQKKDYSMNKYLLKCNYNLLRFWESDVYKDPDKIRETILSKISEIKKFAPNCDDCGVNTLCSREYFMVNDELWNLAVAGATGIVLCVGCLENRINRELNFKDFSQMNVNTDLNRYSKSERLLSRMSRVAE